VFKIRPKNIRKATQRPTQAIDAVCNTFRNKLMTKHYISNLCHRLNFLSKRFTNAAVAQKVKYRFLERAKRSEIMPITRLEMVTSTFHSRAERGRNAAGTWNEMSHMFAVHMSILYHSPNP
jgi:hypothetical protein